MLRTFVTMILLVALTMGSAFSGEGDVVRVGQTAPNVSGIATDGRTVSLDAYKGKTVLLVFFATWCGGCAQELPRVERDLQRRYKDSGLTVIGVGRNHGVSELSQFKRSRGFSFTIIEDPRRELYTKYATDYIPRCYLIGKDGIVKFTTTGPSEYDFEQLKSHVKEELSH